jgi:hypothetical protein
VKATSMAICRDGTDPTSVRITLQAADSLVIAQFKTSLLSLKNGVAAIERDPEHMARIEAVS